MTGNKMTKPLEKLGQEVYAALPFKKMQNGESKEIDVPRTSLKLKMQKLEIGCYFTISKNGKKITDNYLFREDSAQVKQLVDDIEIQQQEFPLLITLFDFEGMLEAISEMMLLADLEFCAAQIIYENPS